MAKLTQEQIRTKTEQWAKLQRQIKKAESGKISELTPFQEAYEKRTAPIIERWDAKIDPLQEKADGLEAEITEWLETQKKSIRIESRSAVAVLEKGNAEGDRVVDAEKFIERCIARKIKNFWQYVKVTIKDANQVMGKTDMDELCTKPKVPFMNTDLMLKEKK